MYYELGFFIDVFCTNISEKNCDTVVDLKHVSKYLIVFNAVKVRPIHITCRDRKKEERIEVKNSALSARAAGESG